MAYRKYLIWGWVIGCWASSTHSSYAELTTHKMWDINYRQVGAPAAHIPQPTSAAPPAAGAPTPNAPLLPPHQTIVTSFIIPPPNTLVSQSLLHPIIVSAATISPIPNTTSPPSISVITITALPPLDPTAVPTIAIYPKKTLHTEPSFKLIYLAPVFVVLGVVWGSLAAWFAYGCATRKPKLREDDQLIGGPRYVPASSEGDLEGGPPVRTPEATMQPVTFSWPDISETSIQKYESMQGEDDPFILPPLNLKAYAGLNKSRAKSTRSTRTTHSDATTCLYDADGEHKKEMDIPWESLRHKSIKRGILEQVEKEENRINCLRPVTGTLLRSTGVVGSRQGTDTTERRPTRHGRSDSDVLVGDVHQLLEDRHIKSERSPASGRPASARADSSYTTSSIDSSYTQSTSDKTQWKPGAGFRIVDEVPLPRRPTPGPSDDAPSTSISSDYWDNDRYTYLPQRHADRSHSSSPVKGPSDHPRSQPHANVLPQSPPQINSPLLHSSLCFTPTPPATRMFAGTKPMIDTLPSSPPCRSYPNGGTPRKSCGSKTPLLAYPPKRNPQSPRFDPYCGYRLGLRPVTAKTSTSPGTTLDPHKHRRSGRVDKAKMSGHQSIESRNSDASRHGAFEQTRKK